jgi:FkbH-like protein
MPPPSRESDPILAGVHSTPPAQRPHQKDALPAVAISATFTAEALDPSLAFWLRELRLDFQVRFAPYNQVFQQLLDAAGLLATNHNGINVVLVRFEDWSRFRDAVNIADLEENVRHLESALRSAAGAAASPVLVCICPASPDFLSDAGRAAFVARSEDWLRDALRDLSAVHLVTTAGMRRLYPVPVYYDPRADELGHVPYTPEFFAALGTLIARKLHAARTTRYKVIALDCDDTLWQGVCGEDGPQGVRLDAGRKALQEFMLAQREAGMLLCLCSKNNAEDVQETFRVHPEMPLSLDHFAASRLNWELKSANLKSLAEELNLAIESFVLVDNSATECAEVQAGCPEVLTVTLPGSEAEFAAFLDHFWAFDRWSITQEDSNRAAAYAQEGGRAQAERQSANLDEFLAALNLQVRIAPMSADQLPRVAQLTHRTNQMNFTTVRRSEGDIQNLLRSEDFECLTVDVSDRFGSYGLTGLILFRAAQGAALTVDTFLLSCRALGRGVEHRMLARLGEIARARGLAEVEIPFAPSARNRPAEALLASIGAQFERRTATGSTFRFPAGYLAAARYSTANRTTGVIGQPRMKAAPAASPDPVDYARIARSLREPGQILEAVRARARRRPALAPSDAPRTDLERQLAQMWAHLLGVASVGIHENFFDLGGHSLLAVQLLSLVHQTFGADLSLKVVYSSDFTVAELAKAIELREIEDAGADRYAAILKELEGLSDEEVRALLAEEQNGTSGGGNPRK